MLSIIPFNFLEGYLSLTNHFCLLLFTLKGEKVRQLKTAKAEKGTIDAEVAILLDLKKKLAEALGTPLDDRKEKKRKAKKK